MPATGSVSHTFTVYVTGTLTKKKKKTLNMTDGAAMKLKSSNQLTGIGHAYGVAC